MARTAIREILKRDNASLIGDHTSPRPIPSTPVPETSRQETNGSDAGEGRQHLKGMDHSGHYPRAYTGSSAFARNSSLSLFRIGMPIRVEMLRSFA